MHRVTRLIDRSLIEEVLTMKDCIRCVEETFRQHGEGAVQMPPKMYLNFPKGDLRSMPAFIPSLNTAVVKNVNVHTGNESLGLPTVMATLTLVDPDTGFPLAIMDATHITMLRTGAAGAVAARYLSRENSETVAFIGTGAQAFAQLEGLLQVRPGVKRVAAFDSQEKTLQKFLDHCCSEGLETVECSSGGDAASQADIVTTITPVRSPIVQEAHIRPGTHINAIGADAEGKEELDPGILQKSRVVIDDWEQASHSGEINVPLREGFITRDDIYGTLGEIVVGKKPGRENSDQITVFDSTGLALQDAATAGEVYKRIMADPELVSRTSTFKFF